MSLKLSNNQKRLVSFLKSKGIDDELFLKLFSLYKWNKNEIESDEDRDVILSFINRFFPKRVEFNHLDFTHSLSSLIEIALTTTNSKVLDAMLRLPNITFKRRYQEAWKPKKLYDFIALNEHISNETKAFFFREKSYDTLLALNPAINKEEQLLILQRANSLQTKINLAKNENLDIEVFQALLNENKEVVQTLLEHQKIEDISFIPKKYLHYLAHNQKSPKALNDALLIDQSIDIELAINPLIEQRNLIKLLEKYGDIVKPSLAKNPNTPSYLLQEFFKEESLLLYLASNPNTPQEILYKLCQRDDFTLNQELAKNPSLPQEYIDYFKLDPRLLQIMNENETLIQKIKSNKEYL